MNKYLRLMTNKTKLKCLGIMILAKVSLVLALVWSVCIGEMYIAISGGGINTIAHGVVAVSSFALIHLAVECITMLSHVLLYCEIATHEVELREICVENLLKMLVPYYVGCLRGEKTAQLNQGVAGLRQLIKVFCNDIFSIVLTVVCTLMQVITNVPAIIACIMLMYFAVTVIISAFQICSQNGIRENIFKQKNSLDGQICKSITNLELICSMDAEDYKRVRLQSAIYKVSAIVKKYHRYMKAFDFIKQNCKIIFQVIILMVSIALVADGKMSAGAVVIVCMLFQQIIKPIDEVHCFIDETTFSVVLLVAWRMCVKKGRDDGTIRRLVVIALKSQCKNIVIRFVKVIQVEQKMYFKAVHTIASFLFFAEVVSKTGVLGMIAAYLQANITKLKLLIMAIMIITFVIASDFGACTVAMMTFIAQFCKCPPSLQSDWIIVVYGVAFCAGSSPFMLSVTAGLILSNKINVVNIIEADRSNTSWGVTRYLKYGFVSYVIHISIVLLVMALIL